MAKQITKTGRTLREVKMQKMRLARRELARKYNKNGYILYQGPSEIDGREIVVIATGFGKKSINTKTGAMIQTWIIRTDVAPNKAIKTGQDKSICGNCPLRPSLHVKAKGAKPCYVKTYHAPLAVFRAFKRGRYAVAPVGIFLGKVVRFGAYGDPGAVPSSAWAQARREMVGNTGYSHQWRNACASQADFLMASVETPAGRDEAKALGYRTFRTKRASDPVLPGEIACPASKEAGALTTCAKCKLCAGNSVHAKDIVINLH